MSALFGVVATSVSLLAGCADTKDEPTAEGSTLALARSDSEEKFARQMSELERRYSRPAPSIIGTPSRRDLCSYLGPFRALEHSYFFYGGYVELYFGVDFKGGIDVVYDLWNRQAAAFAWKVDTTDIGTVASIGAGAYVGYGFGEKDNIISAWATQFDRAEGNIGLSGTRLGVEAGGFRSKDGSIIGVSLGVSAGLDLSWPLPVTASLETGYWIPNDAATQSVSGRSFFTSRTVKEAPARTGDPAVPANAEPRNHAYVQYDSSLDLAFAILETAPGIVGVVPAAEALAIGVARDSGHTVEDLCPGQ